MKLGVGLDFEYYLYIIERGSQPLPIALLYLSRFLAILDQNSVPIMGTKTFSCCLDRYLGIWI